MPLALSTAHSVIIITSTDNVPMHSIMIFTKGNWGKTYTATRAVRVLRLAYVMTLVCRIEEIS